MRQPPSLRNQPSSASPALQLHQRGDLNQAERLYRAAPATRQDSFEAWYRLGVLQFQQGRHGEAAQSLRSALNAAPTNATAWSDLGVVQAALGRLDDAVACYDKAIAFKPDHAFALNNRGSALVALGRPVEALESYDRALAVRPKFVEALANRGGLLRELGRPAEALKSLDRALAIRPDSADALNNRANALVELNRFDEALRDYDKALAANPASADALNNRGNALMKLGRAREALASYEQALGLAPRNAEAWSNRGNALRELKRYHEALESLNAATILSPRHANAFNHVGNTLLEMKRPAAALAAYERALALSPDFVEAHVNRAAALLELKRPAESLASCERALALNPDHVMARNNYATSLVALNREAEALASYDKAIALKPDYATAFDNKGVALLQLGRVAEARAALETAIALEPTRAHAYHGLALAKRFERGDPLFPAMERLAGEDSPLDADGRIYAHFALGKACADVADVGRAFRHLSAGCALKRKLSDYDEAKVLGDLQRMQAVYTSEFLARSYGCGDPSAAPVFVVGMPRSGTTLIEQILASHRDVHGAGEISDFDRAGADLGGAIGLAFHRPELVAQVSEEDFRRLGTQYLRRVGAGQRAASRIVNKLTANFRFAGLIALALPNARILHVRRDPVDTCFSCFSTLFAENQPFTYDLGELGRYYRVYEALMRHWRATLPCGMMLEVCYEDVVADLEGQARRIVAHCDLDWDARCLDFHRNARSVRSASLAQVRRPLYASSVGRWRPYEACLAPLLAALGYLTPAACAESYAATGDRLRNCEQLRRSPVAPPTLLRQSQPATLAQAG